MQLWVFALLVEAKIKMKEWDIYIRKRPNSVELFRGTCAQGIGGDGKLHYYPNGQDGAQCIVGIFEGDAAEDLLLNGTQLGIPIVDN